MPHDVWKAYMAADPSYIAAVLDVMDRHAGGSMGYLREKLGLSNRNIERLRRIYTA